MNSNSNMESEAVREAALEWHVRLTSGRASEADHDAFVVWLSENPAHMDAYEVVEEFSAKLDTIAEAGALEFPAPARVSDAAPPPPPLSARLLKHIEVKWAPALAAAVIVVAGAVIATTSIWKTERPGSVAETFAASFDSIAAQSFIDGSSISLSPLTSINKMYTDTERRIDLTSNGLAYFDVSSDSQRPFIVRTGSKIISVVGTQFEVIRDRERLSITVAEGIVAVRGAHIERLDGPQETRQEGLLTLRAGDRAIFESDQSQPSLSQIDLERIGQWRSARLIFDNTSLVDVVGELNLFFASDHIAIGDPEIAKLALSGVVVLSDVKTTVERVGALMELAVVETDRQFVFEMRKD